MTQYLLVDGTNNFIRNYVVNPTMDVNGEPIGGFIGFLTGFRILLNTCKPDVTVVIWDGEGGSTRRRSIYSEYKAGRKVRLNRQYDFGTDADAELRNMQRQYELTMKYLKMLGVTQIRESACEADDVIAYVARHCCDDDLKTIVSTDKDMLQLIDDRTQVFTPVKKKMLKRQDVLDEYGILPENLAIARAIVGDGSDNIAGLKGIGMKTVSKLFPMLSERHCPLSEVFDHCRSPDKANPKYELILSSSDVVNGNFELMQLSSPLLGAAQCRSIRNQLQERPSFNVFETRVSLARDNIQIKDEVFSCFKEQTARTKR